MSDSIIPASSSMNPLVSRLDRLDFLMKYLERRTKLEGSCESNNVKIGSALFGGVMERPSKGCLSMDLALKEVESKGSLVDRVAALESRLFQVKRAIQISLDMDQCSSSGTSGDTTLSLRSREESSCSLPTFNHYPNYANTIISQTHHEIEENPDVETHNIIPSPPKRKSKKNNKEKKDEKSFRSGKKRTLPSWTHMRLLGC